MAYVFKLPLHFEDLLKEEYEAYYIREEDKENEENVNEIDEDKICETWFLPFPDVSHTSWSHVYLGIYNFRVLEDSKRQSLWSIIQRGVENALEYIEENQEPKVLCNVLKKAKNFQKPNKPAQLKKRKKTKKHDAEKWIWDTEKIEGTLELTGRLLEKGFQYQNIMGQTFDEDFLSLFGRVCYVLLEDVTVVKNRDIKNIIVTLVEALVGVSRYRHCIIAAFLHLISKYEHAASLIGEIIQSVESKLGQGLLATDMIREIAQYDPIELAKSPGSSKNIASFLCEIADRSPVAIKDSISMLIDQLDCESYFVRNGVVHALGRFILSLHSGENKNEEMEKTDELKNSLFHMLLQRVEDIHAFGRSKTLQTWQVLIEEQCVPLSLFPILAQHVVARLQDKSSIVRKNATILFESMLSKNPFGPSLKRHTFEAKLNSYERYSSDANSSKVISSEENIAVYPKEEINKAVEFYQTAVTFIHSVYEGVGILSSLIWSRSVMDVQEAISCIVTAKKFDVDGSAHAANSMLGLIFSRDNSIKSAVIEAYTKLLIGDNEKDSLKRSMDIIRGIVQLVIDATVVQVACVERLLEEFGNKGLVDDKAIQVLWDIVMDKIPGIQMKQRKASLLVLSLLSKKMKVFPSRNLALSILKQLKLWITEEPELCCLGLRVLQYASQVLGGSKEFEDLTDYLSETILSMKDEYVNSTGLEKVLVSKLCIVEEIANTIYDCSSEPSSRAATILWQLYNAIIFRLANEDQMEESEDQMVESEDTNIPSGVTDSVIAVSVLFHFSGQVIINELSFWERVMKKRKQETEKESSPANAEVPDDIEIQQWTGMVQPERYSELVLAHMEKELTSSASIIGRLAPLAVKVALRKQFCPIVKACATLYLSKLMCISEKFCEQHLKVLFTILASDEPASIRADIIIALNDLAVRYPNLIEPWSTRIFSCLHDKCPEVRRNTIMSITFLVLNDMVKIRGQVSEIALCLVDDDAEISRLCRSFFFELANKSKGFIYNILPEVISSLATMHTLSEESFRTIMSFLFGFIDKERHTEGLIERICQRFRLYEEPHCWRSLAFCLSLLSYSERTIGKLANMMKCYNEKLYDDEVFEIFCGIVSKTRKFSKAEFRAFLDEFEEKLVESHRKYVEMNENVLENQKRTPINENKQHNVDQKPSRKIIRQIEESDEDTDKVESDESSIEKLEPQQVQIVSEENESPSGKNMITSEVTKLSLGEVLRRRR
eukprot:jgi/Galph1/3661/GphlegSOOS_G2354.1